VAIELGLKSNEAIQYHQEYFMLLGCTEFTKVYLRIKDNPWPYVNLVDLAQNSGMRDGEVVELLKIANGYLPRIRLEYDRLQAELNSLKAEISNSVRTYQDFCDRNLTLKNREDELKLTIIGLEVKEAELHKTTELQQHLAEVQENYVSKDNLNLAIKQEETIITNGVFIPPSNMVFDYLANEDETLSQVEPSSRPLIFDTFPVTYVTGWNVSIFHEWNS
jgi:hypothetical protein